jgi:arylsulfatase A-like enzyme
MKSHPNVLIIMTDQHRPDHTGFGGNQLLKTPHLDAIADRSMRFDRCFVANPICMPNRSSIVTGRLPSLHGTRFNGIPLAWDSNTFMRVLRSAGYHTAYFGKSHLQNMGEAKQVSDAIFAGAPAEDARLGAGPPGWQEWEYGERHKHEKVEIPSDFYGIDEVDLTVNHSDLCSGHYYQWLLEKGADPEKLQGSKNALPHESLWNQVWRTAVPEDLYPTTYIADQTASFLSRQAAHERPFLAFCSFPDPHHPFTPPGHYFDLYDPKQIELPRSFHDSHERSPKHFRAMASFRGKQGARMAPWAPTEDQLREMAAAEYGMIAMIDDGVGRVLTALEDNGMAEDTIVIFTSDHGDMFGDHGLMLKAGIHYDGCTRVPLLISVPGKTPGVSSSLVSSLDLAQTVLELTGEPEYQGMQGVSLAPLLDDSTAKVRDHVLVEEDEMFDLAGIGEQLRMRTLVTDEARFTLYHGSEEGELFDLDRDPDEMQNLYAEGSGKALRAEMAEKLARVQMQYADRSPKPTHMA